MAGLATPISIWRGFSPRLVMAGLDPAVQCGAYGVGTVARDSPPGGR